MRVTYTVNKNEVFKEVRRLTAYVASSKKDDNEAYKRLSVTESDSGLIEQFWRAACSAATEQLMHFVRHIENSDDNQCYEVVMEMASLYDTSLNESIEDSLKNFFINLITSKWFNVLSQDDAKVFAEDAMGYMKDVEKKVYHRKRPTRGSNN